MIFSISVLYLTLQVRGSFYLFYFYQLLLFVLLLYNVKEKANTASVVAIKHNVNNRSDECVLQTLRWEGRLLATFSFPRIYGPLREL